MDGRELARSLMVKQEPQVLHTVTENSKVSITKLLGGKVESFKDAMSFMRQFALCCDDRTVRDQRVKEKPWSEIHDTFFGILGLDEPYDSNDKEFSLSTVTAACNMLAGETLRDFYDALDNKSTKGKSKEEKKVHEFFVALEKAYKEKGYIKKAA